jgi:outer membrane protein OmpA-like peptidoglycan-associated protein
MPRMRNLAPSSFVAAGLVAGGLLLAAGSAHAQTRGFDLDRFNPSERGSEWFAMDTLDFRGDLRPAVGIVGEFADKPLRLTNPDGTTTAIVASQLYAHVGASLIFANRFRLAFDLPVSFYGSGNDGLFSGGGSNAPTHASLGDTRVSGDLRIFGEYGSPFSFAVGGQVFMPTGEPGQYTGDPTAHGIVHLLFAGEAGAFVWGANVGYHIRGTQAVIDGVTEGNEIMVGGSVGLRLANRKLLIGPEIYASSVVSPSGAFLDKRTTPAEVILGGHYTIGDDWRAGVAAGPGITRGDGTPEVRILGSIEWTPGYHPPPAVAPVGDCDHDGIPDNRDACRCEAGPPNANDAAANGCPMAPQDADGDGIPDKDDACPTVFGVRSSDPAKNGCPADRDGDGIYDKDDACPDVAGVKSDDPKKNGCPADKDGDGILDKDDACPDVAGVKTDDPKTNGCPPNPDRDGDGIKNEEDACPDEPGPKNADPKKNGCPLAVVRGNEIKISEQVKFRTGSAAILKDSDELLGQVGKILKDHTEIKHIRIEGHTDNVGDAAYNKKLSQSRAESVMKWLIKYGVEPSRMSAQGFGKDRPIADNKTAEGRKDNRRVEFHIAAADEAPPPPPAPKPAPPKPAKPKKK